MRERIIDGWMMMMKDRKSQEIIATYFVLEYWHHHYCI